MTTRSILTALVFFGVLGMLGMLGLLGISTRVSADDGGVNTVGGSVRLMDNVPGISMQSEVVHAFAFPDADSNYVECVFYLHNAGAERDVLVGFPEDPWADGAGSDGGPFIFFRSYLDGHELPASRQEEKLPHGGSRFWWTKSVHFPAGTTVAIRNEYAAQPGHEGVFSPLPECVLTYILWTGASWDGPIGSADIVITVVDPDPHYDLRATPDGFSRSGNAFKWHFENFEPTSSDSFGEIGVAWTERLGPGDRFVQVEDAGWLRLMTAKGREIVVNDVEQIEYDQIAISPDGKAVGWLALYPNPSTSYPIPLKLTIYSEGKLHEFARNGLPIWHWQFTDASNRVAFEQETVHGGRGVHYELREVSSGRLLDQFSPSVDGNGQPEPHQKTPEWVSRLESSNR
jgi:hypothetical protein